MLLKAFHEYKIHNNSQGNLNRIFCNIRNNFTITFSINLLRKCLFGVKVLISLNNSVHIDANYQKHMEKQVHLQLWLGDVSY